MNGSKRGATKILAKFADLEHARSYFRGLGKRSPAIPRDEQRIKQAVWYLKRCLVTKRLFLTQNYRRNTYKSVRGCGVFVDRKQLRDLLAERVCQDQILEEEGQQH